MHKIGKALFFALLILILPACFSQKADIEAVRNTVDAYLEDCQKADFTQADTLIDPQGEMGSIDDEFLARFDTLTELGMNEETAAQWKTIYSRAFSRCFQSWTIESVEIEKDTAQVLVNVTGIDGSQLEEVLNFGLDFSSMPDWTSGLEQKMIDLAKKNPSDDEITEWLFEQMTPILEKQVDQRLKEEKAGEVVYQFDLIKKDGKWYITQMKQQ